MVRARREKKRKETLGGKTRIGVSASLEERVQGNDPFWGFEMLDLGFEIPEDLDGLGSAQLAVSSFVPYAA